MQLFRNKKLCHKICCMLIIYIHTRQDRLLKILNKYLVYYFCRESIEQYNTF